jgi:hypothetical protein
MLERDGAETMRSAQPRRRRGAATAAGIIMLLSTYGGRAAEACVGSGCMQIWSTADGGGALAVQWDFANAPVQTYESFCTSSPALCFYSSIDPGFMAPPDDPDPTDSFFRLVDGTRVSLVIVAIDPDVTLNVNGNKLTKPGDSALLGTMPTIHVHPSWQLLVPPDQVGDFSLAYMLTTTSALYAASDVYTATITNIPPPPTDTPSPTPVVTPSPSCVGDCNGDGMVTIDEILLGMNMALGTAASDGCLALDANHDDLITVDEILQAVNDALGACPAPPRATFDEIQQTIFTPSCAVATCHDSQSHVANLVLEAGQAYAQLVNVPPDTFAASQAGLLRVKPGAPDDSFLLVKLEGPPASEGSRMPLTGDPLSAAQIDLVRNWILQGALP